ncbi:MAG TPA: hypothetical protein VGX25_27995 [Actinophytocola sp.]|uniref:hypothetical protein n=1 Tax=Actinophytocola sp. TaxID=1872138 RepID=UPI002DDD22CF|nr:hypothetical protein [Actinophytocola sp.]HEV2783243.1 hypothetical protein [Actinophytocola sp.]
MRRIVALLSLVSALSVVAPAGASASADLVILLPGASGAEGIAAGKGSTFFAGDLFRGDIFRGDARRGTAAPFIDAPDGRMAVGMVADVRHDLLFVAGGPGKAYVYHTRTGATVASYDFADPSASFINDVTLTPFGAWFTDSMQAKLFFVPLIHGVPGPFRTLALSGPAADTSGDFNLNGIRAADFGRTLIVAHSTLGQLFTVNPSTGSSAVIAGVDVPSADGLVLDGRRLWVVQNGQNVISQWRLSGDLRRGTLVEEITSPEFHVPATAALFGDRLAAVNTHFDTGFPPTSPTYEVVVVDA